MPTFELTAAGLQTARYPEARARVVDSWRRRYGQNAQTASDNPDGQIIDILALLLTLLWEAVGEVYANSFFRTSRDVYVDLLLDLFGRKRLDATPSTVTAIWYGDASSTVVAGSIASVIDQQTRRFATDANATTVAGGSSGGPYVFQIRGVEGNDYAIAVGLDLYTVTAGSDDPEEIAAQLQTELAAVDGASTYTGVDPDGLGLLVLEGTGSTLVTASLASTEPDDLVMRYGVRVAMGATETGPIGAAAGTLTVVETNNSGIDGVINLEDANPGRAREVDAVYKRRYLDQRHAGGTGTVDAIPEKLLELFEERLDDVRLFDHPGWFEVVAVGDATDEEVAAAVFANKPAGIRAEGDITVVVTSKLGTLHEVGISRGVQRYLWLDVTITPGEGYPSTGTPEQAIKDAIVAFLQRGGDGELRLGEDFYRYNLATPIKQAMPGVRNAVVTTGTTTDPEDPMPSMTAADVIVAEDEILRVSSFRIEVHQ